MNKLIPVILSGGSGTRLWPLSRKARPKQFLKIHSDRSLFQETLLRLNGPSVAQEPIVVCSEDHRFTVAEQLQSLSITPHAILLEPFGRNTAPALVIAALKCLEESDRTMLVLPSDHIIENTQAFHDAIAQAQPLAEEGKIVTFGIIPTYPETGFGYIQAKSSTTDTWQSIEKFVEKPALEVAEHYLSVGNYFWNSGMFMFTASKLIEEVKRHRPDIFDACKKAIGESTRDLDFIRLNPEAFQNCPSESIDYAVMEHTADAVVVPMSAGWNDLGSWSSIWDISPKDANNNAIHGDVLQFDSKDCHFHSEHRLITTIGLRNMVVIETKDAVLVANRNNTQEIKTIVDHLKASGRQEAENHREVHRPWGKYDSIDHGSRYQVKRITVIPGAKLSVQMHHHRAEHWIVVSGTAKATIDGKEILLSENQSTYVPVGAIHSLENPGKVPVEMIEVQSGSYLGEDDIVRFEDLYGRVESP